ncbi:MAG: type II toxin-antitoxin system prevent-host-death family antitoxin [Acidobacteria bacterium]|nr:type II toxin-antitoxin system prevent-host-death family antitoxin [Acidobacteriota bacterium]
MPVVNVHEAKTQLSRLLAQVEAGEEVVIARRGQPRGKRQPDVLKGKIAITDAFFDPLPEDELKLWEGG